MPVVWISRILEDVKYLHDTARVAGVLVPLAALRSARSTGCGEFADLPLLAHWCAATGLRVIQLLPVNDSGGDSSPYSALSAVALHPMYVRIEDLPDRAWVSPQVQQDLQVALDRLRQDHEARLRFDYSAVATGKLNMLRTLHAALQDGLQAADARRLTKEMDAFLQENPWVRGYAVYRALKERRQHRAWMEWGEHRDANPRLVDRLWEDEDLHDTTRFFLWMQMRLAQQFSAAAGEVAAAGVALKGDIPILMNEDSADVWYRREIFQRDLRAGAPPDMFSRLGQNWGFPVYNWENLAQEDFQWWRQRLQQAAQYYHAYRIDHVLGFFRIWAIPAGNSSGLPGFFWPQNGITMEELADAGFDEQRVRWLREPHIPGDRLREAAGDAAAALEGPVVRRIGTEDLFLFAEHLQGEHDVESQPLPPGAPDTLRGWLLEQFRDRVLLPLPDGTCTTAWTFRESWRFQTLSPGERERLEDLAARHGSASNEVWARHGGDLLSFMKESSDMLTCAEDLGVIPEAVPRVLRELGILGLMIPRWSHYWDRPGQPAIPLGEYPEASVCAASVHDTSTMRGWWEQEEGRETLWELAGGTGPCPGTFDVATARTVYRALMRCASRIVVFQMQDLLALTPGLAVKDPATERVNIPGTANSFNWTWRMPVTLETLTGREDLTEEIRELVRYGNRM